MRKAIALIVFILLFSFNKLVIADELDKYIIPISNNVSFDDLSLQYPNATVDRHNLFIKNTEVVDGLYVTQFIQYLDLEIPVGTDACAADSTLDNYKKLILRIIDDYGMPLAYCGYGPISRYDAKRSGKAPQVIDDVDRCSLLQNVDRPICFEWIDDKNIDKIKYLMQIYVYRSSSENFAFVNDNCSGDYAIYINKKQVDTLMPYSFFCLDNGITIGSSYDSVLERLPVKIEKVNEKEIVGGANLFNKEAMLSLKFNLDNKLSQIDCLFINTSLSSYNLKESFDEVDASLTESFGFSDSQTGWIEYNPFYTSEDLGFLSGMYKYSSVYDCGWYTIKHEAYFKDQQSIHTISVASRESNAVNLMDSVF